MNKVQLIGNLGKDPEKIPTKAGTTMVKLCVATTDRGYVKKDGTKVDDRTDWHNITVFGKLAEICEKYLSKGSKIYIEGSLHYQQVKQDDGSVKTYTSIDADNIEMLDSKQAQPTQQTSAVPAASPQPNRPTMTTQDIVDAVEKAQSEISNDLPF